MAGEGGMQEALHVVAGALADLWDHILAGAVVNLLWLILVLLVIPAPPATLALVEMARRIHTRDEIGPRAYLGSVCAHFGLGWRWGAVVLSVTLVLAVDWRVVSTGGVLPEVMLLPAQIVLGTALVLWALLNFYALPLLFAQEQPSVWLALRNAAVMALRHPGYTLVIGGAALLLVLLGSAVVIVGALAGPLCLAFLADRAVADRLAQWRAAAAPPAAPLHAENESA